MVTGTDEHGEKIAASAAKAGLQPQEHCDAVVSSYTHLWRQVAHRHPCARRPLLQSRSKSCRKLVASKMNSTLLSCSTLPVSMVKPASESRDPNPLQLECCQKPLPAREHPSCMRLQPRHRRRARGGVDVPDAAPVVLRSWTSSTTRSYAPRSPCTRWRRRLAAPLPPAAWPRHQCSRIQCCLNAARARAAMFGDVHGWNEALPRPIARAGLKA